MTIRVFHLPSICLPLLTFSAAVALAQVPQKSAPTSKLFVVDATGSSQIDLGHDRIEPLIKNGVHSPEGSVIESKANSTDSLVLSNGTALYIGPDTRLEVKKFLQEPFLPNRTDLDNEPSISQTVIRLVRGSVGICASKLVAGSSMIYQTPQATIHVRGRRLLIQTDVNETRVTLLEGDVTVVGDELSAGSTLKPGQQAIARKTTDNQVVVTVQPISDTDRAKLDEMISLACISRSTVYFDSVERTQNGATEQQIVPVRTTPANQPTEFTISPARIRN